MLRNRFLTLLLVAAVLAPSLGANGLPARAQAETPVTLKGRLEPHQYVTLTSPLPARVEQVAFHEGDTVAAGAVLLTLEGGERAAADLAAAELEVLQAQQALDELQRKANLARALAGVELARVQRSYAYAEDHYESLARGEPELYVKQARANLRLLDEQLKQARKDLAYFQGRFTNPDAPLRYFMNDRAFRLRISELEGRAAELEGRRIDAQEKLDDMLAGPDEIDLQVAAAEMQLARQQFDSAAQEYADLLEGPDPQALEAAQANLKAAQAHQRVAQRAGADLVLQAPFAGELLQVNVRPGEWAQPGVPLIVLADLSRWSVEIPEIEMGEVLLIEAGMCARVTPEAYPDLALGGVIAGVSEYFTLQDEAPLYSAQVDCACTDPRLRWGLTVQVEVGADCPD